MEQRFDSNAPAEERAFQALLCMRVSEELPCVQHQVATVGAVQAAGLDQREVGDEIPELRVLLDATKQVFVGRLIVVNDWCPLRVAVVDEYIDGVSIEPPACYEP
jgi:hypothetical protein